MTRSLIRYGVAVGSSPKVRVNSPATPTNHHRTWFRAQLAGLGGMDFGS